MSNIHHNRFNSTLADLQERLDEIDQAVSFSQMKLSLSEETAAYQLAVLARKYLCRYTELQEQAEYDFVSDQR